MANNNKSKLSADAESILTKFAERNSPLAEQLAAMLAPRVKLIRATLTEAKRLYANVRNASWEDAIAYIEANPPSPAVVCALIFASQKAQASERAKNSALKSWRKNPSRAAIQAAKAEALKLWTERHNGKHRKPRLNKQFATECVHRWPVLNYDTVLKWCTKWEKGARQSASAS